MSVCSCRKAAALCLSLLLLCVLPRTVRAEETPSCVTVVYHGETLRTPVREETAEQLLARLKLTAGAEDILSHPLDTPVCGGMTLRIDQIVTRRETYTTTLPHETQICNDASLPEGTWEVLIPGKDGELRCTADVTYINGCEISRDVLTRDQTIAPVTEVVAQGTGPVPQIQDAAPDDLPVIADDYITLPTGEVLTYTDTATVRATAYTHTDAGCDMITSTGSRVHVGTVAVDPRYIPYGTRMFIIAVNGSYVYGISEAEDCGGDIKGDRVDLYLPTYEACMEFGRRVCTVYYLG